MQPIEFIYLISSVICIGAAIPQLRQLTKSKNSDDLSAKTWSVWSGGQFITTLYAFYADAYALAVISCVWLLFYLTMVFLIMRYRSDDYEVRKLEMCQAMVGSLDQTK